MSVHDSGAVRAGVVNGCFQKFGTDSAATRFSAQVDTGDPPCGGVVFQQPLQRGVADNP
jgi:hypothetical protein